MHRGAGVQVFHHFSLVDGSIAILWAEGRIKWQPRPAKPPRTGTNQSRHRMQLCWPAGEASSCRNSGLTTVNNNHIQQHPHRTRCITIACDWGHTVKSSCGNQGMRVKLIMTEQKEGKTGRRRNHQAKLPTTTPRRTTGTRCEESRSPGCADDSSASRQSHSSSLPQSLPPFAAVRGPSGAHH